MQLMTDNSTKTLINLTKQIYNGLTQAIEDGDTKEASERLKQDDVISAKVTAETDARIQADSDEAGTRQAKDAELQTAIETETSERKGADTSLQANIDKEATTRANADTAINTKLDAIKQLSDLFYLDTPTGAKGDANINGQFINYFGRIKNRDTDINGEALPISNIDDQDWVKRAVRILTKRMIDKQNNRGVGYCMGWFAPGTTWCILGSCSANASSTNSEGDPIYSNFIAFSYGAQSIRLFGTSNYIWSFDTLPLTSTVNTLINNAKTALETAYKNADTKLQTDITTAYQQADTNLSNTLTQAYADADTALKTELEGKIAGGVNTYLKKYEITAVGTTNIDYININQKGTVTSATISITGPGTSINGWYAYMLQDGDRYIDGWLCNPSDKTKGIWKLYQNNSTITTTDELLVFYCEPNITGRYEKTFLIGAGNASNITLGQQIV